jgi:Na+/H+ antiporter NhaD/arsenite permease-like protein
MAVTINAQTIIGFAALVAAVGALLALYNKGYDFVQRQKKQDEVIHDMQAEQELLTYGVLACLKGLMEQGCDGPVKEAVAKFEEHLNKKAHERN